ncbi:hypothetical protein L873DRAFT_1793668 [Choiromyces venosus 120613-1]|uniref:Uncharacterized protein n=1 Tax=Choiromyces venosus 120613-1 TaxID=1336337 RepID=A0A3N4J844_9PEZI|nr:hypothetical protein L873DRAFT_1793668 [Choiromyces venosus 120613-1]
MKITTENSEAEIPLKKVQLTVDLNGFPYTRWFIIFDLVKYDIVLGKEWLAEVEHKIDHRKNILMLGRNQDEHANNCWDYHIIGLAEKETIDDDENREEDEGKSSKEVDGKERTAEAVANMVNGRRDGDTGVQGYRMGERISQENEEGKDHSIKNVVEVVIAEIDVFQPESYRSSK